LDYVWHEGENLLEKASLVAALGARGLTLALIDMLFRRLIAAKVFRPGSHTVEAGSSFEGGLRVHRLEPETTHYLGVTRERWYAYPRDQYASAPATRANDSAPRGPDLAGGASSGVAEGSPSENGDTLPQGSEPLPQAPHDPFADFSRKQRQLLVMLQGKPSGCENSRSYKNSKSRSGSTTGKWTRN
jgi:hypothetical protein